MSIRSAARALIIHDGKILLNRCRDKVNGEYYVLPGGGQNQYETITDALLRECREETGYAVKPIKLACVCEEICMDQDIREKYPDYAHKLHHIFLCGLADEEPGSPIETDMDQVGSEWVDIQDISKLRLFPKSVGEKIADVLNGTAPVFLGSERIRYNHG